MAKATDVWMPLDIGDFLAATTHLTATEIGAYMLMIMRQWQEGPMLESDLRSICRMNVKEWRVSEERLKRFLTKDADGCYYQKRTAKEKEKAEGISKTNRENGGLGGRPKKRIKSDSKPNGLANNNPNHNRNETQEQLQGQPQEQKLLAPEALAKAVQVEAGIFGIKVLLVLTEVCRRELAIGIPPDQVREALVGAWEKFKLAAPNLEYLWGAEKFFGEGHWKDEAGWPWKEGTHGSTERNSKKGISPAEQRRVANLTGLANIAARRYGRGPLAHDGQHDGPVPESGDQRGNAGDEPRSVGGDDGEVQPRHLPGRVIEGDSRKPVLP